MTAPSHLPSWTALSLTLLLLLPSCLAFTSRPPTITSTIQITPTTRQQLSSSFPLFSAKESTQQPQLIPTQSSLDKLEVIKLALKRPRGASIGVEYAPSVELSDGDLSILSMQLRKAKCAAIFTSDAMSVGKIAAEQKSSRGDFPGPVPVVYCGKDLESDDASATAVVVEYGQYDNVDMEALNNMGIIWKVNEMDQLQQLIDMENNAGGVYLLSQDMLPQSVEEDANELKEMLSTLPKSIITIAPLQTMLPDNAEIALGKHYASMGISSLLLQNACVGDDEDIKYSHHAIDGITKKSSSSFSMTGLTGSTNGHFGVSSHSGEVKWRRNE